MTEWGFYGRSLEVRQLSEILARGRWFFVKIAGRRRIGKTFLINNVLKGGPGRKVFYVQVPDSGEPGVLSAVADALEVFHVPSDQFPRPRRMGDLARLVEELARAGYVVVLDEFQYFNRKPYTEFCSLLQAAVDRATADAHGIRGGLIVLGSIHTEMQALLEERSAPLYNRVTDSIDLPHLDVAAVVQILREHADAAPERLLFLWTLFEGVPKFYRDCYERGVLGADRGTLLRRIFFEGSSPLRSEADNWFLRELRGRYDTVLKFVARKPGSTHGQLLEAIEAAREGSRDQISSYLKILSERYRLVEGRLPIFARPEARKRRYYLSDNFLQSWLAALANPVSARDFQPLDALVGDADARLADVEGHALERLAATLYEERSRKGLPGFPLTSRVVGYWDRGDVEIDLVAVNERDNRIRFGSCKRNPSKLLAGVNDFRAHVRRFLDANPKYKAWTVEYVGVAPRLDADARRTLARNHVQPEDLEELTRGL